MPIIIRAGSENRSHYLIIVYYPVVEMVMVRAGKLVLTALNLLYNYFFQGLPSCGPGLMTLLSLPRTSLARFVIYSMLNWSTIVLVTVGVWSIFRGCPPLFLFSAPDVVPSWCYISFHSFSFLCFLSCWAQRMPELLSC